MIIDYGILEEYNHCIHEIFYKMRLSYECLLLEQFRKQVIPYSEEGS